FPVRRSGPERRSPPERRSATVLSYECGLRIGGSSTASGFCSMSRMPGRKYAASVTPAPSTAAPTSVWRAPTAAATGAVSANDARREYDTERPGGRVQVVLDDERQQDLGRPEKEQVGDRGRDERSPEPDVAAHEPEPFLQRGAGRRSFAGRPRARPAR